MFPDGELSELAGLSVFGGHLKILLGGGLSWIRQRIEPQRTRMLPSD